jgi:copper homeostasis protein
MVGSVKNRLLAQVLLTDATQVMIRPRTGSFVYTQSELITMELDILALGEAGATGFVFGCLTADGSVDVDSMNR